MNQTGKAAKVMLAALTLLLSGCGALNNYPPAPQPPAAAKPPAKSGGSIVRDVPF